jgi:hypothetical protein
MKRIKKILWLIFKIPSVIVISIFIALLLFYRRQLLKIDNVRDLIEYDYINKLKCRVLIISYIFWCLLIIYIISNLFKI